MLQVSQFSKEQIILLNNIIRYKKSLASVAALTAKLLHKQRKMKIMKLFSQIWVMLLAMVVVFSSCELVGDIFKAGFWTAIIVIVLVIGLIIWLLNRFRGR